MNAQGLCCDRISELPDSLLTRILSYLPTKDSVKTSVLSKRWEFLWLKVCGLDINNMDFLPYGEALLSFMDRFLESNRGSCLQTFKMKYYRYTEIGYDSSIMLVEWIPELVHRRLQHLVLENRVVPRDLDIMPDCIYLSKTLVSLKLDYVSDGGRSIIENLISGSPVLENVTLEASIEDLIVWTNVPHCLSSTLEHVKIGVNIVMTEAGIKLANYFLENSAILKKLSLSCKYFLKDNKTEAESYKKLLTSTKLSPTCQVLVD